MNKFRVTENIGHCEHFIIPYDFFARGISTYTKRSIFEPGKHLISNTLKLPSHKQMSSDT